MTVVRWLLVVELLGIASWPLCLALFGRLPDGGFGVARLLGLLLVGYATWLPAGVGLFPFDGASITAVFLVFLSASALAARGRRRELRRFISERKGILVFEELLFLSVFAAAVFIQAYKPDITLAEKEPDMMFLQSVLRGGAMPPEDLWFAGEPVNYYYLGYALFACLVRLAAARPEIGFNLAVATVVPLAALGSFSLAYNLVRRRGWALLAPLFLLGLGNLDALVRAVRAGGLGGRDWWIEMFAHGSREILPGTIHEFPAFSFLLGDLHPHYMFMAFCFLPLTLLLVLIKGGDACAPPPPAVRAGRRGGTASPPPAPESASPGRAASQGWGLPSLFLAFALGAVFMFHTWDYPTYVLLTALCACAFLRLRRRGAPAWPTAAWLLLVVAVSVVLFLPFRLRFAPAAKPSVGLVAPAYRSALGPFLTVNGLAAAALLSLLAAEAVVAARAREGGVGLRLLLPAVVAAAAAWLLTGTAVAGLAAGGAAAAAALAFPRSGPPPERRFVLLLALVCFALFLGCEIVYLKDFYGERLQRQNTVFKYYFQAWILASVVFAAGGCGVAASLSGAWRAAWRVLLVALVVPSLIYPVLGTWHRCGRFRGGGRGAAPYLPTLDGAAYIRHLYPGEYRALGWVRGWVPPGAVVLEATGDPYSFHGRVSTFTGRPTVLGWGNQESLWRDWSWKKITERSGEIARIYGATVKREALPLLRKHRVSYVYVGTLERKKYPRAGLDAFAGAFPLVYRGRDVLIYRVPGEGAAS
ncbi:MAG: hypothetical protein IT574_07435 [Candidatus Aureabacteria bacterium]|nr:hypothetical protein [Candidatus Auribacterota bacterium]